MPSAMLQTLQQSCRELEFPPQKAAETSGTSNVGKKEREGYTTAGPRVPCAPSVLPQAGSPAALPGRLTDAHSQPVCPPLQTLSCAAFLYVFSSPFTCLKGCEGEAKMGEEESTHPPTPRLPKLAPVPARARCQRVCGQGPARSGRTLFEDGANRQQHRMA